MTFDTGIIWQNLPLLLAGIWLTLLLVLTALAIGIIVGLLACAGNMLGRGIFHYLSVGYVGLFRALPETVIIFWLYYCAPLMLNARLSAFWSGTIALAIPSGAYLAGNFSRWHRRGATRSIGRGARGRTLLLLDRVGRDRAAGGADDDPAYAWHCHHPD